MAPTPSPTLVHQSNSPSARHLHHLRRQTVGFAQNAPGQSSALDGKRSRPRTLDPALQPSVIPEGPSLPPFVPAASSGSVVLASEPSANPSQPQDQNQPELPGNIVVSVVVLVLVLGGLIGLVVGGEALRRQAKTTGKRMSPPLSRDATGSSQQRVKANREKFPHNEKTLTPLTRPPPVVNRRRRLSDIWPIRNLSRALCNRRSRPEQVERSQQRSAPVASSQTTWSEFSPVTLYVPPPRTVLTRIPEECEEDYQQTNGDDKRATLRRLHEPGIVVSIPEVELVDDTRLDGLSVTIKEDDPQDCRLTGTSDEDGKSLGSSAPGMTSDESSIVSLESLADGNDRESLREEAFELRRAQTKSMQMNKGVLLSLSVKRDDDDDGPLTGEGILASGASFSAVDLDEFPSPPSILPVIPSFASGIN